MDAHDTVISSSDPTLIGTRIAAGTTRLRTTLSDVPLELEIGGNSSSVAVSILTAVPSAFAAQPLGSLRLELDWQEVEDLLDAASQHGTRALALLDRDGRIIAASRKLRERHLLLTKALAVWRRSDGQVVARSDAPVFGTRDVLAASTSTNSGSLAGLGWTTLVVQPLEFAFEPIHRMALIFLALLGVVVLCTLLAAFGVSHALARPIVSLTAFARDYMRNKVLQAPASGGSGEVGELADAFVRMIRDIDQSQQNLVRASKLAVVGEMSAVIAHEVRTPLGILRSSAQILHREPHLSNEGQELVGFIESETERLNRLVSAMLDTARPRRSIYAATDIHALIRRTIAMLTGQAEAKRIVTTTNLAATNTVIECDEEQITQVVLNILMNGLQILHNGGHMEIATSDAGEFLEITVADDGPGIDPAERARVFEAFFFRREGGIGLGLAVVQQIVSGHGGEIEAAESPLGGALFRVRLPHRQESIA
jgi:signal transduction histidine kinase